MPKLRGNATALAVALLACLLTAPAAFGSSAYDRVLTVGFKPSASAAERAAVRHAAGVRARASLAAPGLQQVVVPAGRTLAAAAAELRAGAGVAFVELPGSYRKFTNDPDYLNQWALNNTGQAFACWVSTTLCQPQDVLSGTADADIDAPEAWALAPSGAERVAVVDTGVAWQHEDLAANIWTNPLEADGVPLADDDPYTGIDGASRSYVDDLHGWDFIGDLVSDGGTHCDPTDDIHAAPDNNPADPDGHGTHVAGIAAAVADNAAGGAGVNPQAKIVPLRAGDECGYFEYGAIEDAFSYAIDHGVRVVNGSFGGSYPSPGMWAIINANPQTLFVFAAGNSASDHDLGGFNSTYPCDFSAPNIICVAATDWNDELSYFSDYGRASVDLAAPGEAIYSTVPSLSDPSGGGSGDYAFLDGTSMASPQVAGAVSRVWGVYPSLEASQVKTVVLTSVDSLPSLAGTVGFGGRLNLYVALLAAANPPAPGWPATPAPPQPPAQQLPPAGLQPGDGGLTPVDSTPPALRIVRARSARIGRGRAVRFSVVCAERCQIDATGSVVLRFRRTVAAHYTSEAGQSQVVSLPLSKRTRRAALKALRARRHVTMLVNVAVRDDAGNAALPRWFNVALRR